MSFSASIDKTSVANNEAYTITTTSSSTLHSVDVYMNEQLYDRRVAAFNSNTFTLSETGIQYFGFFDTNKCITASVDGSGNNRLVIHNLGSGSYLIDPNGSSTSSMGTPYYMTIYDNYAYVLTETEGIEVFRYYLLAGTVTRDLSPTGLAICSRIAAQSNANSKFVFGTNGICYLVNGPPDGENFVKLMRIDVINDSYQILFLTDVAVSVLSIAIDSFNTLYLAESQGSGGISRIFPTYENGYYNIYNLGSIDLDPLPGTQYVYVDPFDVLYVIRLIDGNKVIQRYTNLNNRYNLVTQSISQASATSPSQIQFSPENGSLYILNQGGSNTDTIYSSPPTFVGSLAYWESPANITIYGNLSTGQTLYDKLKVNQNFVVNCMSDNYRNPRYQNPGDSSAGDILTVTNKAEYIVRLSNYKNSTLITDTYYVNNRFESVRNSIKSSTCSDLYHASNNNDDVTICFGSSVDQYLYICDVIDRNFIYRNSILNIVPYDIFIDTDHNNHVLRLDGATYYVSKYDNYLNFISQFSVEYNSGSGIIPRCICVDDSGNTYVCYDMKVKKYNAAGTFVSEVAFSNGSFGGRRIGMNKDQTFLFVSDNALIGFQKIPPSMASSTPITLPVPGGGVITQFDLDIYDNFHVYDENNSSNYYIYSSTGSLITAMTLYLSAGSFNYLNRMRLYNHLYTSFVANDTYSNTYPSYRGYFNAFQYVDIDVSETGTVTLSGEIPFVNGSTYSDSYQYRNHTYTVNTSATNVGSGSSAAKRIAFTGASDNSGNSILPERISWVKDGNVIKKDAIRNYQKVLSISDIDDPEGIAMDSNNNLYVMNEDTYCIDVYDTNAFTTLNYPIIKSIPMYSNEGICRDVYVDQNNFIYALFDSNDNGRYVCRKYDTTGQNILLTLGPFDSPYNMCVDTSGTIYIADRGNDEVIKYNSDGIVLTRFQFSNPISISVDRLFNIYISDDTDVYKYDFEFVPLSPSPYLSGFNYVRDLYTDASNNLFITDRSANRVYKYNSSGALQFTIGSNSLSSPQATVLDSNGNIFVVNNGTDSVIKFDPTGTNVLKTFMNRYSSSEPYFAVDGSGGIYTLFNETTVVKYSSALNIEKIYRIDPAVNDNYSFDRITCDRVNQFIYIIMYSYGVGTNLVHKLDLNLNYVDQYTIPSDGFQNLYSITTDNNNNLYLITNDNGTYYVKIFNVISQTVTTQFAIPIEYDDIVVDTTNGNTIYIVSYPYQVLTRCRYNGSTYDLTDIFTYPSYKYMHSLAIDSTHLYLGTLYNAAFETFYDDQAKGINKVYKLLLAGDAYTVSFAYNASYPEDIQVYNGNLYVNDDYQGLALRIFANNTQNILGVLSNQDYDSEITTDSLGNIYVENTTSGDFAIKYNSSGELVAKFSDSPNCSSITTDSNNNVYIASNRYMDSFQRTSSSYVRIDIYNSAGTLTGTIQNSYVYNDQYTDLNYPLRRPIQSMTCDSTYLYVAMNQCPVIRFNLSTLALDYSYNLTGVVDPRRVLFKNNFIYTMCDYYQISKYQLTSTGGTRLSRLNSGVYSQQFGVDTTGRIYIPSDDRIFLFQNDMSTIVSTIVSLDCQFVYIGPGDKIYMADDAGSVSVYNQTVNTGYVPYYDATEDGEYEITVEFYDYTHRQTYEVTVDPTPSPETYIEYLQRIDLEMIPYYIYDAVLSRNEAQIITAFKANRVLVSKLCNFYQKMKNAHENPRRLNTPFYYNVNWYTKIRYDESQPTIPYLVGYKDMYFMYLYLYNKTVFLNMYYLLEVARKYYRRLLLAQRAINMNQDTTVYYNFDASITNNFLLLNFVNSFFNTNIYNPFPI